MSQVTFRTSHRGFSLIELLVALAISMVVVIAAASFFLATNRSRDTQDAASGLRESVRFATEMITKSIQQAGYQNYIWNAPGASGRRENLTPVDGEPDLRGYNNSAAGDSTDNGSHDRATNRVNNSDTLILRYQGSGASPGDGNMIDCLGRAQPQPVTPGDRAYSIFEVRKPSTSNEPELRCKYYNAATGLFTSEVIVRGVETFQVLYGVCTKGFLRCTDTSQSNYDPSPDRWMNAAEVEATATNPVTGLSPAVDPAFKWRAVRQVRVGMVLRSPDRVAVTAASGTTTLSPLGPSFSQGVNDTLTVDNTDGRMRSVVTFTVNVRNAL